MNRAYTVQLDLLASSSVTSSSVTLALPHFPPLRALEEPQSNRQLLLQLIGYLWRRRARLAALVGLLVFLRNLYRWSQSAHSLSARPLPSHTHPAFIRSPSTGLWLYTRAWRVPPHSERGRVFLLHAYRDHTGRYEPLAAALNQAGYSVFGLDLQGHGRSGGERGYCESARHYLLDADHWLSVVQSAELAARPSSLGSDVPNFLFGHSMGATLALQLARVQEWRRLVAADPARASASPEAAHPESIAEGDESSSSGGDESSDTSASSSSTSVGESPSSAALVPPAQRWRIDGLVLSCPALVPDHASASPLLQFLASALADLLPKFSCAQVFDARHLSGEADVVARFQADPLVVHAKPTARWGHELLELMADARAGVTELRDPLPMLVLQGALDRVVSPQGAHFLMAHARACVDKQLLLYHSGRHDLWLDTCREQFLRDVRQWLDQHTPSPPQLPSESPEVEAKQQPEDEQKQ